MKKPLLSFLSVLVLLGGGYWLAGRETPPAKALQASRLRQARPAAGLSKPSRWESLPLPEAAESARPANDGAQAYDMGDPGERERLAASMRAQGAAEQDIQTILSKSADEPAPVDTAQAQVYDLGNAGDRERFAALMRAQGSSEEDILRLLRQPADDPPADAVAANGADAQAYDLGDPSAREQFASSMRAGGVSEDDIQQILGKQKGN
jgi:hypothetical protein